MTKETAEKLRAHTQLLYAAPDLLRACEMAEIELSKRGHADDLKPNRECALCQLRLAIAKAKGPFTAILAQASTY